METLYTAYASATGGRNGKAVTSDGALQVEISPPGVNRPGTTNPEQLFACGYAACFGGATEFVARQRSITFSQPVQVDSEVSLLKKPEGGFTIGVSLHVHLFGVPQDLAEQLVAEAHSFCPYSNATRGNVDVQLSVAASPAMA